MLPNAALRELKLFHRALGDVTRLRIVHLLATNGEHTVGSLGRLARISQPLLSWHLRRLERAGIVRLERSGRVVHCTLDRTRFAELQRKGFRLLMNPSQGHSE